MSIRGARGLGCLSPLALGATLLGLGATAAATAIFGGGLFSPGALASTPGEQLGGVRSHAEIASCSACHPGPFAGVTSSDLCAECHQEVDAEIRAASGLHGALPDAAVCLHCHSEHRGTLTQIDSIDHERFGFSLRRHESHPERRPYHCNDCHRESLKAFSIAACLDCHDTLERGFASAHTRQWGDGCLDCHDGVDRFSDDHFDHGSYPFSLTGKHQEVACADCHRGVRSIEGMAQTPSECADCHADPEVHRGQFGIECGSCHSTGTWEGATFDHSFPLDHGSGENSECITCHPTAGDYKTYSCYGCHDHTVAEVRAEHLEEGITDFQDCVRCHPTGLEEEGEHEGRWRGDEGHFGGGQQEGDHQKWRRRVDD